MRKVSTIIMAVSFGLFTAVSIATLALSVGKFKQNTKEYTYVDYDWDDDTGLISVRVEGQKLTISPGKIVSLPTDYESGNILYVSEYKTFFFTQTVYEVEKFIILIPTDGHGDDWKLGV